MTEFITVWEHNEPLVVGEKIVRCRDCKYLNRLGNVVEAYECDLTYMNVMPNDFCSWGERKEDA